MAAVRTGTEACPYSKQFDYRDSLAPRGGLFQQPPDAPHTAAHDRCGKDAAREKTVLQNHGFRVRPKMTLANEYPGARGGRLRSPPPRSSDRAFPRICRENISGEMRENPRAKASVLIDAGRKIMERAIQVRPSLRVRDSAGAPPPARWRPPAAGACSRIQDSGRAHFPEVAAHARPDGPETAAVLSRPAPAGNFRKYR